MGDSVTLEKGDGPAVPDGTSSVGVMSEILRFGRFDLDCEARELCRDGTPVRLRQQPLRVLETLATHPGRVVSRSVLKARVWDRDTFVDFEQGLNDCVKEIRAALGDRAETPTYIQTLPRRGYRFLAPVERVALDAARGGDVVDAGTSHDSPKVPAAAPWSGGGRWVVSLLGSAALGIGLWAMHERAGRPSAVTPARLLLAVVPFENLSGDAGQDYLAEGLSEDLSAELARRQDGRLAVMGRASAQRYLASPDRLSDARHEGVDYLLAGSVRREGDRLRVTARLVNTTDQTETWAGIYEENADAVLAVQSRIAAAIARSLPIVRRGPVMEGTQSAKAYDAYLRGLYFKGRGDTASLEKAAGALEEASRTDPQFAVAFATLADVLNHLVLYGRRRPETLAESKTAARRALLLDPTLASAHTALGGALHMEWDFEGAAVELQRGLDLGPGIAMTHYWAAGFFASVGRQEEAIAAARQSLELDPAALSIVADVGWYCLNAGRYDDAIAAARRSLDLEPGFEPALWFLLRAYEGQGRWADAHRVALDLLRQSGAGAKDVERLRALEARAAIRVLRERRLAALEDAGRRGSPSWFNLAAENAELGRVDDAFRWLELATSATSRCSSISVPKAHSASFGVTRGSTRCSVASEYPDLPNRHRTKNRQDAAEGRALGRGSQRGCTRQSSAARRRPRVLESRGLGQPRDAHDLDGPAQRHGDHGPRLRAGLEHAHLQSLAAGRHAPDLDREAAAPARARSHGDQHVPREGHRWQGGRGRDARVDLGPQSRPARLVADHLPTRLVEARMGLGQDRLERGAPSRSPWCRSVRRRRRRRPAPPPPAPRPPPPRRPSSQGSRV